jgi:hypothetical protein
LFEGLATIGGFDEGLLVVIVGDGEGDLFFAAESAGGLEGVGVELGCAEDVDAAVNLQRPYMQEPNVASP